MPPGFHLLDLIIIAGIALALFGPKALQSVARNAGKGVGQAKIVKDKVMSELPMDEISKVTNNIPKVPQIPLNSQQALKMLITSDSPSTTKKAEETTVTPHNDEGTPPEKLP